MKVFKVTDAQGDTLFCETVVEMHNMFASEAEHHEIGDKYSVEVIDMPESEYRELPEFKG